jgi:hypothetical protein
MFSCNWERGEDGVIGGLSSRGDEQRGEGEESVANRKGEWGWDRRVGRGERSFLATNVKGEERTGGVKFSVNSMAVEAF